MDEGIPSTSIIRLSFFVPSSISVEPFDLDDFGRFSILLKAWAAVDDGEDILVLVWILFVYASRTSGLSGLYHSMDVPFITSGAICRAQYALVRKVEAAESTQLADQYVLAEVQSIRQRFGTPTLSLVRV
jgi:hypothetical protein